MSNHQRILYTFGALLLVVSCGNLIQAATSDYVNVMTKLGEGWENVGKTIRCLADLDDDPAILAKAYKVVDAAVVGIKQRAPGPLTSQVIVDLESVLVAGALAGMRAIDARCSDVSDYCPASYTPRAAEDFATFGKALETIGSTLSCLVGNVEPVVLEQIPIILTRSFEDAEKSNGTATSVAVLLPGKLEAVEKLQKLSTSCADVVKCC